MNNQRALKQISTSKASSTGIAMMYLADTDYVPGTAMAAPPRSMFVNQLESGAGKIVLRANEEVDIGTTFYAKLFEPDGSNWLLFIFEVLDVQPDPEFPDAYHIIARSHPPDPSDPLDDPDNWYRRTGPRAADYRFFLSTHLIKSLPPKTVCALLNSLSLRQVTKGERFIQQGDPADAVYLIQQGTCTASVEENGRLTAVARLEAGNLVGEMAILTGERRSAHVEAETDMRLWALGRDQFEALSADHPELRIFLTDLVTNWFDARPVTARRRIGKYSIADVIGSGGYSIVYQGSHLDLNMPVAVKMMKHDMAMDRDFLKNFRDEAKTIAQFDHDNIIRVYDIEERFRTIFIIMEYLQGHSLRTQLNRRGQIPVAQVLSYLLQVGSGLNYAHERGIVHQDVKPGNIFILPRGRVKILDFGLSCRCGSQGQFIGTPSYMSPEQIECLEIDERTDIYALGIMAYELVAGRRPYPEDDPNMMLDLHVRQDIPDPAEAVPGLPEELRCFILKACARDPEKRYRNIRAALQDLQPLVARLDRSVAPPAAGDRKMTSVFLTYGAAEAATVDRLLQEIRNRIDQIEGVKMKISDSSGPESK
jgi:tRNA A-37 threonylcarbamoyl transferase component Bud32